MVGDFTVIISIPSLDGSPVFAMFLSETAKASDLKYYKGNAGATWQPDWWNTTYCLNALNTYNTGSPYRIGLHRYGLLAGGSGFFIRYQRVGTTISMSRSTSQGGPFGGTLSGTCLANDKILCFLGSGQGYGDGPWTATVRSVTGQ